MRAALIANGVISDYPLIKHQLFFFEKIVAVDGGLNHCQKMNITPDLLIGDLDSVEPQILAKYPHLTTCRHPVDKDQTDLELAVQMLIDQGFQHIVIFAALGNRSDHTLNNLYLLKRHPHILSIESEQESLRVITESLSLTGCEGLELSLLPIGEPALGVTTTGLKWELKDASLDYNRVSISNRCIANTISIQVKSGNLLLSLQKKPKSTPPS
ncbi:MAG: hypothetical protein K0S07_1712 [Chlamydiales bacterium]|jgi:thiamine pyrophosphokinase|nr:hypothetical protein [Chlamydiales bacterium]